MELVREFRSRPAGRATQGTPKGGELGGGCDSLAAGPLAGADAGAPVND
jgi:hypothetical protein